MLDITDPISGIIGVLDRRKTVARAIVRAELLLEMLIASVVAFLTACGTSLVTKTGVAWAIGAGFIAAAVALFATFQASPNSKGLVIALPSKTADDKLDTPMTTVERKQ